MQIAPTPLPGLVLLTPKRFEDPRGYFEETWNHRALAAAVTDLTFVQDNQSLSRDVGTLRGLHMQAPPHAQAKLVRCLRGAIFDVAVDIRKGSPTYGQWFGVELTPQNGKQLLIPAGFLHGFVTRLPDTEVFYKCSDYYAPAADHALQWDGFGIDWGLTGAPILSVKDANATPTQGFDSPFVWEGGA